MHCIILSMSTSVEWDKLPRKCERPTDAVWHFLDAEHLYNWALPLLDFSVPQILILLTVPHVTPASYTASADGSVTPTEKKRQKSKFLIQHLFFFVQPKLLCDEDELILIRLVYIFFPLRTGTSFKYCFKCYYFQLQGNAKLM